MQIYIILQFYSEQKQSLSLALRQGISEVQEFPFISRIRVGFETQLIETTKYIPTVINEKVGADIFHYDRG
jgi:hypothetical protein